LCLLSSGWDDIKALFRGEPGFEVPSKFLPFGVIHMAEVVQATGEEGYGESTAFRYWRYDGYISVDVRLSDIRETPAPTPEDRWVDVPSYNLSKALIESALDSVMSWAGPDGEMNPVVLSDDGNERSVELLTDTIRLGLGRRSDSITNRGSFEFHIYTRRQTV
jgi:hypothetical protein